ncbi:MAG: RluA family pseudouridine synthase, partial [Treponema sp.]|nr:RluA family pseudouridine synthase [Treponema sp.]
MEFREFTAGKDDDGRRLDRVLRKILPENTSSGLYSALRKKLIRVNDRACGGNTKVSDGDCIQVAEFLLSGKEREENNHTKNKLPPLDERQIVFMNEHVLILNKKAGISVQPGGKGPSLWEQVLQFYQKMQKAPSLSFTPGPLHRLDRNTSGLVAFSLSLEGAKWFTEAMKEGRIKKDYLGISEGCLKQRESWEDFLDDSENEGKAFQTVRVCQEGERAVTEAIPLSYSAEKALTLVQFKIHTGKKHHYCGLEGILIYFFCYM